MLPRRSRLKTILVVVLLLFSRRLWADVVTTTSTIVPSGMILVGNGTASAAWGSIVPKQLYLWHTIFDAQNTAAVIAQSSDMVQSGGQNIPPTNRTLTATGSSGRCYRARLRGELYGGYGAQPAASNEATSYQVCVQTATAGGGGEILGGCPGGPPPPEQQVTDFDPTNSGCNPPSPIVIDAKGKEPDLSGDREPVTFDILKTGQPIQITWTKRHSDTGFLVLDRNNNGKIDDAGEMFGNHTLTAYGEPTPENFNGFAALAEYDNADLGGNNNGRIDPGDAIWSRLRVWIDSNHDGVTQPEELLTLESLSITGIDRDSDADHQKRDKFGNLYKFRGTAWRRDDHGREVAFPIYDIIFKKVK
jgi:hypothetical protein